MITFELNTTAITAALAGLAATLSDMSPVMNEIGAHLRDTTEDRFKTGTGPDGSAWAPRSPVTLARYEREGKKPGPHPLTLTGAMSNSIFHSYGSTFAEVSSNAIQAAVMQFGAAQGSFGAAMGRTRPSEKRPKSQDYFVTLPWGDIPARPFIGISDEDEANVLDIIAEALARSLEP